MPRTAVHAQRRARRSLATSLALLGAVALAAPFAVLGVSGAVLLAVLVAVGVVALATAGGSSPVAPAGTPPAPIASPRAPAAPPRRAAAPPPARELVSELLYVEVHEGGIGIDGSLATDVDPAVPAGTLFHLRVERPASGALRWIAQAVLQDWSARGNLVALRFRRRAERVCVQLTSGGTTIVLDVDDVSLA